MRALVRLYDGLLLGLAAFAGAAFGAMAFIVVYEVLMRWLGWRPPGWPVAVSEFTLLYATVLAAPWVLRHSGHAQVTTLLVFLPPRARLALGRAVSLLGAVVCALVAWYALSVTLGAQGLEIRSFAMPKWVVYAPLPLGFLLLSIEFARHMVRGTLFAGEEFEYFAKTGPS